MSAIADFVASDTIMIASFSGTLHALGANHPLSGSNYCITKQVGSLDINLNIPGAGGLVLQAKGLATAGGTGIAWQIDQDLNVDYMGHTLKHAKGTILVGIEAKPPSAGTNCGGASPRTFAVAITENAAASALTISVGALFFQVDVEVDQISVNGTAGKT